MRICFHGLALALLNIAAIIAGFGFYTLFKPANQIAFQAPVAALLSIAAFAGWAWLLRRWPVKGLLWQNRAELAWVYLAALLWSPLIFVPLHYTTQGYLTAVGNIVATWLFQLPVNLLALLAAGSLSRDQKHKTSL